MFGSIVVFVVVVFVVVVVFAVVVGLGKRKLHHNKSCPSTNKPKKGHGRVIHRFKIPYLVKIIPLLPLFG